MKIRIEVPGKPVPQARARPVRMPNGKMRMYTPQACEDYQDLVRRCAIFAGCPLFAGGARVHIRVFLPDNRVRDIDNVAKGVLDSLQGRRAFKTKPARRPIAWANDNTIASLTVERFVDKERPRVEITIDGEVATQHAGMPAR
jgi:Holliday junction resolvase RusA-like endonuclease